VAVSVGYYGWTILPIRWLCNGIGN